MIGVRVVRSSTGKPVESIKVSVSFEGLFRGMDSGYTDSSGEIHFNCDPGTGEIYVDGSSWYKGRLEGLKTVYI